MTALTVARAGALISSAVTMSIIAINSGFRADNAFLVPDVAVSLLLVVGALAPTRLARPLLLAAFGMSIGVFLSAASTHIIDDDPYVATVIATILSVIGACIVGRDILKRVA